MYHAMRRSMRTAVVPGRVRWARREYLLPLALSLVGVAATVVAAAEGWYAGMP